MNKRLLTFMIFVLMIGLSMLPSCLCAQIGGYATLQSETFYKSNVLVSVGAKYKEFKLGYFYQQAKYDAGDNFGMARFKRQGIIADIGIGNVDRVAFFSIGGRLMTTNNRFVDFKAHGTLSWRFGEHIEIPITLSTYEKTLVGSIGLRCLF